MKQRFAARDNLIHFRFLRGPLHRDASTPAVVLHRSVRLTSHVSFLSSPISPKRELLELTSMRLLNACDSDNFWGKVGVILRSTPARQDESPF
jgi:hypothetical protein